MQKLIFRFVIKGDAKRPAVLCTDEKTYSMTKVETSNTVLLLNERDLEGSVDCYYEVSPIIPADLDKIISLVSKAYFPQVCIMYATHKLGTR